MSHSVSRGERLTVSVTQSVRMSLSVTRALANVSFGHPPDHLNPRARIVTAQGNYARTGR